VFAWEVWQEVAGSAGDDVFGVYKPCHWDKVGADGVDCVTDIVAEDFFAVLAPEEVVAIGIE
jgi:hypothetical protein